MDFRSKKCFALGSVVFWSHLCVCLRCMLTVVKLRQGMVSEKCLVFNGAVSCQACLVSVCVWNMRMGGVGGIILRGRTRTTQKATCHNATLSIARPTLVGLGSNPSLGYDETIYLPRPLNVLFVFFVLSLFD